MLQVVVVRMMRVQKKKKRENRTENATNINTPKEKQPSHYTSDGWFLQ